MQRCGSGSGEFVINWPPGSGSSILNSGFESESGFGPLLFFKDSKKYQEKINILQYQMI
jgi:hypothetical protein